MSCPRCGADPPDGAAFCPACGQDLRAAPREERKLVSALFVDVVGSTARADGADPEDVRDRNRRYYDAVRERIEAYGGIVEKYIGDAVMAVFGVPQARSDDAERAVRAAYAIHEAIRGLNEREPDLGLEIRSAVCTGEALVVVDAAPGEAIATGDMVNTAARLQAAAPPGGTLVDEPTYRLARHAFAFAEAPPVEAKGKRETIPVRLLGEPTGTPGARPTSRTRFVGRDPELVLIRAVSDRAVASRQPHLVSIVGPTGIGKTRTAGEVAARFAEAGGRVLWGRSLPYEEQTPYRAMGEIVRSAAGIFENDPVETARVKLAGFIGTILSPEEAADATRNLSLVLGLGLDTRPDERIHLFYAVRRVIERLAEGAPLMLVFEDIHWASEALVDLVEYLTARVADVPVVFLALARAEFLEERPTWGGGMLAHTAIRLDPLADDHAREIVSSLVDEGREEILANVVAAAEGNPLFLEELVASVPSAFGPVELPTTVHAAIAARIDTVPASARAALLNASVIGQSFWRGVLADISGAEDVEADLAALEARGLIVRHPHSQVEGETEYAFRHVTIRDVAYGTLPRAERRRLHAATAELIERTTGAPDDLAWILSHHWREAGEPDRAVPYLVRAAERARDAFAVEEMDSLYEDAASIATDDATRTRTRLLRGLSLAELGEYRRADAELKAVEAELTGTDLLDALLARSRAAYWTERTGDTFEIAGRTLALVRELGAADYEAPALARLSQAHGMRGDPGDVETGIEVGDRALDAWVPGTHEGELANHYHLHADLYYWAGRYDRALELSRSAASAAGDIRHSAEALIRGAGMQGLILAGIGRYEEAIQASDAAIEIARRLGRPDNVVRNYSTCALREVFAADEAYERSAVVVERLGPSEFNMPWMNARADLIGAQLLRGDFGAFEQAWPTTWEDALGSKAWERWLISGRLATYRAELELALGRTDDAVAWAGRALEMATETGRAKYRTIALVVLGRALSGSGSADAAVEHLSIAVDAADALGSPLLRWQARAALADALARARERPADPDAYLAEAAEIIRAVVDGLSASRAATYLAEPSVAAVLARTD